MRILYVITGLGGGGAEKVVADLADQMIVLGHEVKIAYLKGDIIVKPVSEKVDLIYLGFENLYTAFFASKKYRNLILEYKPDVVHSHMVHANIFARLNRIFEKTPKLICTAHSSNEGGYMRMLAYRITNNIADVNTNVSASARNDFIEKKAFNENSIFVYNGINLNRFKNIENQEDNKIEAIKLIAVGRLNVSKDYPNLLKAIKIIKNKGYSNFSLSIVGDGEEKNNIINLINNYGLQDHVSLLGRRDDIPELMSNSDIFILSSSFEGFGLVVAEAMACNTFVIGTDCGGVKEVMGGTGVLVQPKDSVALAQALIQVFNMSENDIALNNLKACKHVRQNFDLNKIISEWLKLYEH